MPLCGLHRLHYSSIRSSTYTKVHTPSYFRGFKCPYTCLFLYRKKLKMSTFLVYLYKKKPLRALKHPYTSIHPYTKFCAHILYYLCYHSHHQALLRYIFSPFFTALYYSLGTAHWVILLIGHSALGDITHWAQRTGWYYSLGTAHWVILLIHFYRSGWYYSLNDYYRFSLKFAHILIMTLSTHMWNLEQIVCLWAEQWSFKLSIFVLFKYAQISDRISFFWKICNLLKWKIYRFWCVTRCWYMHNNLNLTLPSMRFRAKIWV